MKKIDNNRYQAEENMTFVRKATQVRMGNRMYLCDTDSIDNYTEEPMTAEEIAAIEKEKEQAEERVIEIKNRHKVHTKQ